MSDPLVDLLKDEPKKPALTDETLLGVLRKGPQTLRGLAEYFGVLTSAVEGLLFHLWSTPYQARWIPSSTK